MAATETTAGERGTLKNRAAWNSSGRMRGLLFVRYEGIAVLWRWRRLRRVLAQ